MKRFLIPVLSVVIGLVMVFSSFGMASAGDKVNVCHATGSVTNPYVLIQVSTNSVASAADWLNGHGGHPGDAWEDFTARNGDYIAAAGNMGNCDDDGPTPTEVTPTEVTPTEVTPTEVTPTEVTPTEITPTEITPTEVTITPPTEVTITPPTEITPTEVTPTLPVITPTNEITPDPGCGIGEGQVPCPVTSTVDPPTQVVSTPIIPRDGPSCAELYQMYLDREKHPNVWMNHEQLYNNHCASWFVTKTPVWSNTGSGDTSPNGALPLFALGMLFIAIGFGSLLFGKKSEI